MGLYTKGGGTTLMSPFVDVDNLACNNAVRNSHTCKERSGGRIGGGGGTHKTKAMMYQKDFRYCIYLFYVTDRSVEIATGYGLDGRDLIPGGGKRFSLHYSVQNGLGAHPASYPICTEGSFPGGKVAGV
jgi:hypothetical protein